MTTTHEPTDPDDGRTVYEGGTPGGDPAGGATTYEGGTGPGAPGTDGRTAYEPSTTRPSGDRRFVVVPDAILAEYDYVRDLSSSGAQADVVLCRHKESGDEVAIKIYRDLGKGVDEGLLRDLRGADPDHVLPIRSIASDGHRTWEIQEYFPLGSLQRLLDENPDGLPTPLVRDLVRELTAALEHIHGRHVVHRDLKADNVLVRTRSPLDVVIGDFGVARTQAVSRRAGSIAGTLASMAPEASFGLTSYPGDWWSLGIILHEALTGRHLFADSTGTALLPDPQIRVMLGQGTYAVRDLPDARWSLLVRGLLVAKPEKRWGAAQVRDWLAGRSPEVDTSLPTTGSDGDAQAGGTTRPSAVPAFAFAGSAYESPAALAAAMRAGGSAAGELMADDRARKRLVDWMGRHGITGADTISASGEPEARAVLAQALLDPEHPPAYRGVQLTAENLGRRATAAAGGDADAARWIRTLREEQVLSEWASAVPGLGQIAVADDRLRGWWRRVMELPPAARSVTSGAHDAFEGLLLQAALDEKSEHRLRAETDGTLRRLGGLSDSFRAVVEPVARETAPEAFGARLLMATHLPIDRAEQSARAAAVVSARRAQTRAAFSGNARVGARRTALWTAVPAAIAGAGKVAAGFSWPDVGVFVGIRWAVVVVLGALLWGVRQRFGRGQAAVAAGLVLFVFVRQVAPPLTLGGTPAPEAWAWALYAAAAALVVGWAAGWLPGPDGGAPRPVSQPADRPRGMPAAVSRLRFAGLLLLALTWFVVATRDTAGHSRPFRKALSELWKGVPEVTTQVATTLAPFAKAQPAWMIPTGAALAFVVLGLLITSIRSLPLSDGVRVLALVVAALVLLFIILGNATVLWPIVLVVGALAMGLIGGAVVIAIIGFVLANA